MVSSYGKRLTVNDPFEGSWLVGIYFRCQRAPYIRPSTKKAVYVIIFRCNGITCNRGRFARAARLMRGLGCAVTADKREVPVLIMKLYYSLWYRRVHPST